MQKITIHLPKYRLHLAFRLIKKRRDPHAEPFVPTTSVLGRKYRVGNLFQKFFRYIFEHKKVKAIFGSNIALMLIATSSFPTQTLGNINLETTVSAIDGTQNPIKTEISTQFPVDDIKITQGYKFYHPGLDLDGITGDEVKPVKKGVVASVSYSKFAYGNSVLIDHGDGLTSLYAHLSKIEVSENQLVTTETKIGEMGSTGRSSGDHLHLEIRDHGIPVNPLLILSK